MNSVNIHNVVKISIRKIRDLDGAYSTALISRDDKGNRTEIVLFAKKPEIFEALTTEMEE